MERVKTVVVGEMLRKGLDFGFSFPFHFKKGQGQNGLMKSYGERAQPLQSGQSKYLAVSPVTDNSEQAGRGRQWKISSLKFL